MSNQWWELQIWGEPALDELLSWKLQQMGCQGTASQLKDGSLSLRGYFPSSQITEVILGQMADQLCRAATTAQLTEPTIHWTLIEEEDWASSWKDHWHPTEIGERLLIHPAWLPLPEHTNRILIKLNPGVAFGTGAHATTQLCLAALEQAFTQPISRPFVIADIGCGTGILAIAALQLGADKAYAVDTDPLAVQAAQECRDLNQIEAERLVIYEGSMDKAIRQMPTPADGFCCNILAHVIIELIPQMKLLVKPGGWGILSGILQRQVPDVTVALRAQGWIVQHAWQQDDWACLHIQLET
jgi:ribosomal protein L11 methyltransferase